MARRKVPLQRWKEVRDKDREKKPANPASSVQVIERLPSMELSKTIALWRNALAALADPRKRDSHGYAQRVVSAVGAEWERRTQAHLDEAFPWPSTEAPGGDGGLNSSTWYEHGVLVFMQYRVGSNADASSGVRQRILREVFEGPIPPAFPREYLKQWGAPRSAQRLEKMAKAIAAFTRNAKRRRNASMDTAINDWETDLEFLYQEFYVGLFRFAWPSSD
ncbi:MAG: hypothetical protein LCH95_23275 [Proteobacteria bacterium]|nr:hypothetical protein [Pseudomonadota bacterium]